MSENAGQDLMAVCVNCGTQPHPGASFCPVCGQALNATQALSAASPAAPVPARSAASAAPIAEPTPQGSAPGCPQAQDPSQPPAYPQPQAYAPIPGYPAGYDYAPAPRRRNRMPIFLGLGVVGLVLVIIAGALLVSGRGNSGGGASGGASGGGGVHAKSGTFTSAGSLPLDGCTATLLADGRVLFTGNDAHSAELYDPNTGNFSPTGSMDTPPCDGTATVLNDGRVLFTEGSPASGSVPTGAELYDPGTGSFSPTGSLRMSRRGYTATLLADGRVLVAGGAEDHSMELYDPKIGTFSSAGELPGDLWPSSATLLRDGRVLFIVGSDSMLYDPATGNFKATGSMIANGGDSTSTLLPDGRVLFTGGAGKDASGNSQGCLASAQLYNPETGSFSATGSMTATRCDHTATLLSDGRVLIAGGLSSDDATTDLASAELYDPKTGTFSATGSMTATRSQHTAVLLRDGRVLIALGWESTDGATAELYQP